VGVMTESMTWQTPLSTIKFESIIFALLIRKSPVGLIVTVTFVPPCVVNDAPFFNDGK